MRSVVCSFYSITDHTQKSPLRRVSGLIQLGCDGPKLMKAVTRGIDPTMQRSRMKSYTLVTIQFLCLIAIALTGPILARNPLFLAMEVAAVLLGVWALLAVRLSNVNVTPDPRPDAQLVRSGPYRWIRHPMYAALLLGTLALVLETATSLRWGLWLALLADLLVKVRYEEHLLMAYFADYRSYMAGSKRLIPLIY